MNKDEQLSRLLRLKRHEQPEEGYFDRFLDDFHQHQLKALATQSAASLWFERVQTAFSALRRPAVAWSAVATYAGVMLLINAWPAPDHAANTTVVISGNPVANVPAQQAPMQNIPLPAQPDLWPENTIPAGQTIQASDGPGAANVPGKRRTSEQQQDTKDLIGSPLPRVD